MYHHPGALVQNQNVIILKYNADAEGLRSQVLLLFLFNRDTENVASSNPVFEQGWFSVDEQGSAPL
jgi:hypothetical protein